jgi:Cu(I)/Ag(I) efflux system membrane protein CusA/SilA
VAEKITLPPGYGIAFSGEYEYLQRALERLKWVVPVTLAIIFPLLYLVFRCVGEAAVIMLACRWQWSVATGYWGRTCRSLP